VSAPAALTELAARVHELARLATAGAADPAWLTDTSDLLVSALLELEERRRSDPRRTETRRKAERTAAVVAACGLPAACERLGINRATAYRHLNVARLARQNSAEMGSTVTTKAFP
jgi:hypothetical protein